MGKNYSTEQRELALAYAPVFAEAIKNDSANNQSRQRILADIRSNRNPNLPLIMCDLIKKTIKSANTPDFHKYNALDLFKELVDCENIDFWIQASQILLPRLAKIGLHRCEEKSMDRGETCLFEYSGRNPTNNKDQAGHFPLWEKNFFIFLLELFQIWSGDFPNFSFKYKNLPADYKQLYRALLVKGVTFPTDFTFMIPPIPILPPPLPLLPPPPPVVQTPAFVPPPVLPPVLPPVIQTPPPPPVEKKDFRNLKSAVTESVDIRNTIADAVMANPNDPNLEFFFEIYENAAGVLEKDKDLPDLGSSAYQPQQSQLLQDVDRERDIAKKLLAAKHAYTKTKDPDSYQSQVVQIYQRKLNKRLVPVPVRPPPPPPVVRSPPVEMPPPRPPVVVATPPPPLVVPQSRIADSGFEMQSKRSALGQSNFAYDPGMLGMSMTPEKVRRALDGPIMTLDRTLVQETVDKSSRCEVEIKELRRQNAILKQKVSGLQKEIDDAEKDSRTATEEAASTTRNNEKALGEVLVLRGRRDDLKDKLARKREDLINLKNEHANYGKESGERRTSLANTVEMLKKLKKLKEVELARYRSKFKQLERDYGQNQKAVDDNRTEKQNILRSNPGITASVIDRTYRDASPLAQSHIGIKEPPPQSLSNSYIQRDVERLVALRTAGQSRPSASISGTFGRGEGAQLMSDLNRDIDSLLKRTDSSLVTSGGRYRDSSPYTTRDQYSSKYHLA